MTDMQDTRTDADVLGSVEQVIGEVVPQAGTRRGFMTRAAGMVAAGAAGSALGIPAVAGAATRPSDRDILDVLATFEAFGVTLLSEAVRRAPGTPSAQFAPVVRAAATTEFHHLIGLRNVGAAPITRRFWIPNAVLDGGVGLFNAIAEQEEIEISAYLVGVSDAARRRQPQHARLFAEALGTEAEHRVLARFASATLRGTTATEAPNNRGFEAFPYKSGRAALIASTRNGIGYGEQTPLPGAFYEYPGDPRRIGTGDTVLTTRPS